MSKKSWSLGCKDFLALGLLAISSTAQTVTVTLDGTQVGTPLVDVWTWHGYDEDNYTNTQPSMNLLHTLVSNSRDTVRIRTHFLLNNSSGAPGLKWGSTDVYTENAGQPVYTWTTLDSIQDAIINGGAFPYTEIAFMPQALSSAPSTVAYRNSSVTALDGSSLYPPNNYTKWANLISAWAQHSKGRYPNVEQSWVWELWNEADIGYWHTPSGAQGTVGAYDTLFDYTEQALHSVLPGATLSGPETSSGGAFLQSFLTHCATGKNAATGQTGTRLDQISFHAKGGTTFTSNNHVLMNLGNQLQLHLTGFKAVTGGPAQFRSLPVVIGEADPDGCAACPSTTTPADGYRSGSAYGAYEVAMMKHSLTLADSLGVNLRACLAWAWLYNGQGYFDGYRDLSTNGIDKPVLNVFKMLGKLRGNRIPVQSSGALGLSAILANGVHGSKPDIDGMGTVSDSLVQLLLWNYHDSLTVVPPATINLSIKMPSNFPSMVKLTHWRVDTTYSNAYTKWLALGSPQSPTAVQLDTLQAAMQLQTIAPPSIVSVVNGQVQTSFTLPREGVSLVEVKIPVLGCLDSAYANYNPAADYDNGQQCTNSSSLTPAHSSTQILSIHSGTVEVNLNEAYTLRLIDLSGRQLLEMSGSGPKRFLLPGTLSQGTYRLEVKTKHNTYSYWTPSF